MADQTKLTKEQKKRILAENDYLWEKEMQWLSECCRIYQYASIARLAELNTERNEILASSEVQTK